jgi:VanZ family protein
VQTLGTIVRSVTTDLIVEDSVAEVPGVSSMRNSNAENKTRQIMLGLWILALAIVITGSLASADALQRFGDVTGGHDKIGHFLAYTVLVLLPGLIFRNPSDRIIVALAMIVLGGTLELAQRFVPGRSSEIGDMIANVSGVFAGYLSARLLRETSLARVWLTSSPDDVLRRS